jgi:hypothetical protein
MEAVGGLLVIIGVACVGGGFLMDSNYGRGTTSQTAVPVWRSFRVVGLGAIALGVVALGLSVLFG